MPQELAKTYALIRFPNLTPEQREHLFRAEVELSKAGIRFDTGQGAEGRDWEFDWSLKGADVYLKRNHWPEAKAVSSEEVST